MNIQAAILKLNQEKRTVFIPYITAGVPSAEDTVEMILTLSEAGAAVIELGVPFSDPIADGPVNMRAMEIALEQGMSLDGALDIVRKVREKGSQVPMIIFSYLNPILAMGYETFAQKASSAGVDGVLCVDLPIESADEVWDTFQNAGLEMIFLSSPTTAGKRLELLKKYPPAFLYYVSRLGVTGAQSALSDSLKDEVTAVRALTGNQFPICVGFGVSTPEHVREISTYANGVIAGSVLMRELLNHPGKAGVQALILQAESMINA